MPSPSLSRALLAASILCALAARGEASSPHLVKDINPIRVGASSGPTGFVSLGSVAVFSATDEHGGLEPWRTDGTAGGTFRLVDVCPGTCSSNPSPFTATPVGAFFFASPSPTGGRELWVTRGNREDTTALAPGDDAVAWVPALRRLFFVTSAAGQRRALAVTDGTPAGTHTIFTDPVIGQPTIGGFVAAGGRLFFAAAAERGTELWSSDGTRTGTRSVFDAGRGRQFGRPYASAVIGNRLVFFVATRQGSTLWRSDGTPEGTFPVAKGSWSISLILSVGRRAFFLATEPGRAEQLWVTDGTARGTRVLTSFPGPDPFHDDVDYPDLLRLRPLGDHGVFFAADDGTHGYEPWSSDGTPEGTILLADLCPGLCPGFRNVVVASRSRVLFAAQQRDHSELMETDGTIAGTRGVVEVCCAGDVFGLGTLAGKALFVVPAPADRPDRSFEIWVTDGTPDGTADLDAGYGHEPGFDPAHLQSTEIGGIAIFPASDTEHGIEPWRSDGSRDGTMLVRDIRHGDVGGSFPRLLRGARSHLYFFADDGVHGLQPWASDGTEAGTQMLGEIEPASGMTYPLQEQLGALLDDLLVFAPDRETTLGVWRSDGTPAGTFMLTDELIPTGMARAGARILVSGYSPDYSETRLWSTDGTIAGTQPLDLGVEVDLSTIANPGGGQFFFAGFTTATGLGVWRSDGTPAGTRMLHPTRAPMAPQPTALTPDGHGGIFYLDGDTDTSSLALWHSDGGGNDLRKLAVLPGFASGLQPQILVVGPRLFVFGRDLWVSDGTEEGTRPIHAPGLVTDVVPLGDSIFFAAMDSGLEPTTLWRSNGTDAGTYRVLDADAQPLQWPRNLQALGTRLAFVAIDGSDDALLETDGTSGGTRAVMSLGPALGYSGEMAVAGNQLYFAAPSFRAGTELWVLPADP